MNVFSAASPTHERRKTNEENLKGMQVGGAANFGRSGGEEMRSRLNISIRRGS